MKAAATMEASASMKTASTPAVTAPAVLSECGIWRECQTDENRECDEELEKRGWAHNLYLPFALGAQPI